MTLRFRLTLAYIGLLVPALVAFSLVVYFIASKRLYSALDDSLQARIDAVEAQLPHDHPLTQSDVFPNASAIESPPSAGFSFRILDLNGRTLYRSSSALTRDIPGPQAFDQGSRFLTRKSGGQDLRVSYEPVLSSTGESLGYIESATPTKQTDDAIDELIRVFVVGGVLVVLATGAPAYVLAGRALSPVRQVSAVASDIERTADFTKRLPPNAPRGETAELVRTFNAMIERVERMLVSQRDFLAESSHELRRPLTVLRTYVDLLQEPDLPDSERTACLQEMRTEAESMSSLISDLLLLSREGEQAMKRGEVDLSGICDRLVGRLREQDAAHKFVATTARGVHVVGDSEKIEQMVRNLLENAAQNTPANGEIDLSLSNGSGIARIEVKDSGRGIPLDEQDHVFDRFFRGREARSVRTEGVGLGLAIVKHVAESHGGSVGFVSSPGSGTCFTVELPAEAKANGHAP